MSLEVEKKVVDIKEMKAYMDFLFMAQNILVG